MLSIIEHEFYRSWASTSYCNLTIWEGKLGPYPSLLNEIFFYFYFKISKTICSKCLNKCAWYSFLFVEWRQARGGGNSSAGNVTWLRAHAKQAGGRDIASSPKAILLTLTMVLVIRLQSVLDYSDGSIAVHSFSLTIISNNFCRLIFVFLFHFLLNWLLIVLKNSDQETIASEVLLCFFNE